MVEVKKEITKDEETHLSDFYSKIDEFWYSSDAVKREFGHRWMENHTDSALEDAKRGNRGARNLLNALGIPFD